MEITKTELERLYQSMTAAKLAEHLGVTKVTVYSLLKRNGIKVKNPRRPLNRIKVIEG